MRVLLLGGNEESFKLKQELQKLDEMVIYYEEPISLDFLETLQVDFVISYNYRHIIPKEVVKAYYTKIVNLHISYLPYNKGSHPNVWSFLEDTPKGVTIHLVDEGVDTGDILIRKEVFIDEEMKTLRSSYLKLHEEIRKLFLKNWELIKLSKIKPFKQEGSGTKHYKREYDLFKPFLTNGWDTPIKEFKENYRAWKFASENFKLS